MNFLSSNSAQRIIPFAILFFLAVLWGGVPSISKYVVQRGVSPLSYSMWILGIAACSIFALNFIRTRRPPPKHLGFYVIGGISSSALPTTLLYYSVQVVPASLMSILIAVAPIFTFIMALPLRAEAYHHLKTLGLIIGFTGMLLILLPDSIESLKTPIGWILLATLTPFSYAVNTIYTTLFRPANLHVLDLATGMICAAAIVMFFIVVMFESIYPIWSADPLIMTIMIYHGLLTAVALGLFYKLLTIAGPLFTIQVTYPITITGIIFGYLIHDEVLPLLVWVATLFMLAGVWFIGMARRFTGES